MSVATVLVRNPAAAEGVEKLAPIGALWIDEDEHGVVLHYKRRDVRIPWRNIIRIDYQGRRPELWGRPA